MKKWIEKSYQMGYEACPKMKCSPCLNVEFNKLLPNCIVGNDKEMKLRVKMYKAYIKGWTKAHLDKIWNIN